MDNIISLTEGGPWWEEAHYFLGQRVKVVTQWGAQYEGIIFEINVDLSFVAFWNVVSLGTADGPSMNPEGLGEETIHFLLLIVDDILSIESIDEVEEPPVTAPSPSRAEEDADAGEEDADAGEEEGGISGSQASQ